MSLEEWPNKNDWGWPEPIKEKCPYGFTYNNDFDDIDSEEYPEGYCVHGRIEVIGWIIVCLLCLCLVGLVCSLVIVRRSKDYNN